MEAMREEEQTSEEQEVGEEDALVRSGGSFEGSWFLGTLIFEVFPLLLKKGLSLELLGLHSIIIMNKQSFLLPEIPQIPLPEGFAVAME